MVEAEDLLKIQEMDSEAVAQIRGVHQRLDHQVSEAIKQDLLQDKAHLVEPQEEEHQEVSFQGVD